MHLLFRLILLFGTLTVSLPPLYAQVTTDTTLLWQVETRDGNTYVGELVRQDAQEIQLRTRNLGEITIQNADIVSMEPVVPERLDQRRRWQRHPHTTRYFFAPNGYNLRQGEGYYQNTWVLFNQVSIGLTDHVSVGVGMLPLFLFAGTATPVWITPKVSIPVSPDRVNLGVGGLLGSALGEGSGAVGIAYGVGTFGSQDRNITLGLGYGFADGAWADVPLITLGGTTRIGQRAFLLTENYFLDAGDEIVVLVSLGGRSLAKTVSFDYGLFIPVGDVGSFIAIPWLSITVPFGKTSSR